MKRIPLGTLAAAAIYVSAFALTPAVAQSDQHMNNLHNNLTGMKAGVSIGPSRSRFGTRFNPPSKAFSDHIRRVTRLKALLSAESFCRSEAFV